MSNIVELKKYLINEDDGYLLNDDNNGKTIMLSGAWGSGKTHFWQKEIEPKLSEELKKIDKSCTYISLYGKDSLSELKKEVFIKASTENSLLSKEVSTFGFEALSSIEDSDLAIGKVLNAAKGMNNYRKSSKGIKRLKDGGLICFDDFERKSKEIGLNDLFGFISQLAIEMNCKIFIILNSDVFNGEEANVFKTVKEKTVNKFFYFEPTIVELFISIYNSDEKYQRLGESKEDILKAIEKTQELNARIYIQVLDNCLEWIERGCENKFLSILIFTTTSFVLSSLVLRYPNNDTKRHAMGSETYINISYKELDDYHSVVQEKFSQALSELPNQTQSYTSIVEKIQTRLRGKTQQGTFIFSDAERSFVGKELNENKLYLQILWKYGYQLYYFNDIDEQTYETLANFVATGILLPKEDS